MANGCFLSRGTQSRTLVTCDQFGEFRNSSKIHAFALVKGCGIGNSELRALVKTGEPSDVEFAYGLP